MSGTAVIQRVRLAALLLILVGVGGTVGYVLIEHWSPFDALYMTVITLATVGYGETHPLSEGGRIFTVVLIISGVASSIFAAGAFAEVVLGEVLRDTLERGRMDRQLAVIKDHVIICGFGRMGQELVEEFRRRQQRFVVIELDPDRCRKLAELGHPYVLGNGSDNAVLLKAGLERARSLVTVAPRDADNVFITLSARAIRKDLYIVARSESEQDVRKLEIAGADRVISPYIIGARRIASSVMQPAAIDFLDFTASRQQLHWEMREFIVAPGAQFTSLEESGIKATTGCTVLAIRSSDNAEYCTNPEPSHPVRAGDTLVVLGTHEQLAQLGRFLMGE